MTTPDVLFSASVIVAFLSGMIALFAPCCITFLLPAYLGQIIRARTKIILGTALFGLGIATIILPITLGLRLLVTLFQEFHTQTYVMGGLLMVFFGILTLWDRKLSIPFFSKVPSFSKKIELSSLYSLGVFGGITTACCAPVLAGALLLAGFSATFLKTIVVGFAYVAGIVFPLFIGALLWESNPLMPLRSFFSKPVKLKFKSQPKEIPLGNLLSGLAFALFGILLAFLALTDRIAMPQGAGKAGAAVAYLVFNLGQFLQGYRFLDYLFLIVLVIVFVIFVKIVKRSKS